MGKSDAESSKHGKFAEICCRIVKTWGNLRQNRQNVGKFAAKSSKHGEICGRIVKTLKTVCTHIAISLHTAVLVHL